jgi:hypothetical protein
MLMNKKLFSIFFSLICSFSVAYAYEIDGSDYKHMQIKNAGNISRIYVKLYSGKEILVYEHSPIFSANDSFGAGQDGDIFSVTMMCYISTLDDDVCLLLVDRRTGEYRFYKNLLALNPKYKVGLFSEKQKNLVIIKPLFKTCVKLLNYKIVLDKDSDFSDQSDFLPNGNLKLIYAPPGHDAPITKIIHINYPKLFADCKG